MSGAHLIIHEKITVLEKYLQQIQTNFESRTDSVFLTHPTDEYHDLQSS